MSEKERYESADRLDEGKTIMPEGILTSEIEDLRQRIRAKGGNAVAFIFGKDSYSAFAHCTPGDMREVIDHLLERHPQLVLEVVLEKKKEKEGAQPTGDEASQPAYDGAPWQ